MEEETSHCNVGFHFFFDGQTAHWRRFQKCLDEDLDNLLENTQLGAIKKNVVAVIRSACSF